MNKLLTAMSNGDINRRVKELIEKLNMNPNSFSNKAGIIVQATQKIIKSSTKPSFLFLFNVLNTYPNVSAEWLLMGRGEIFKEKIVIQNTDTKNAETENTNLWLIIDAQKITIGTLTKLVDSYEKRLGVKSKTGKDKIYENGAGS